MSNIRVPSLHAPIDVGDYLFRRLYEVGIRAVHGVPGADNIDALHCLPQSSIKWIGHTGHLTAAYAADGYARVKGISALVTTSGAGELAALSGVAGSYAEHVPVIHIVGTPSRTAGPEQGFVAHRNVGNGSFGSFGDMSKSVSCCNVSLTEPEDIPSQIDHAIRSCYVQSRPVYIALPKDVVSMKIEGQRLRSPINLNHDPNDQEKEEYVVDVILRYMHAAQSAVILVDAGVMRSRAMYELQTLVESSGLPTFVAPMAKGSVNESIPNFCGVYSGSASSDAVRERIEAADLVLSIGALKPDFNATTFTYHLSTLSTIDIFTDRVCIRHSEYPNVRMNGVLRKLPQRMQSHRLAIVPGPKPPLPPASQQANGLPSKDEPVTMDWFWPFMSRFIRANDIVITDPGTSQLGIWETKFPPNVTTISQILWPSLGFGSAACLGACLAAAEIARAKGSPQKQRVVLFTGDASFQVTASAVSTLIRNNLSPVIFLINNDGYTVDRLLQGEDAEYNEVAQWSYQDIGLALGASRKNFVPHTLRSKKQVADLINDQRFGNAEQLALVEVIMRRDDVPAALKPLAQKNKERKERLSRQGF